MWWFLWRYVIVPLLVYILTHAVDALQLAREREVFHRAQRADLETIRILREQIRKRRDEEDRHPFRPWLDAPAADAPVLPREAVGDEPIGDLGDAL